MKHVLFSLSISVLASAGQAQETPEMERVLLPVTVRGVAGAFGTSWTTDLWVRVDTGGRNVSIRPLFPITACDPPCPDGFGPVLAPYSYPIDFIRTHAGETAGSLMYVQRELSDDVHLSLRLSNGRSGVPVELPVVRARFFTNKTLHIMGIPVQPSSRAMLRVYGIDPASLTSIHVKGYSEDSGVANTQVLDMTVPLSVVQTLYAQGGNPIALRPPVAEVYLNGVVGSPLASLRLELDPVGPAVRIWAFVSVTDNANQAVTLRTPN
jgi:hypothetical protein